MKFFKQRNTNCEDDQNDALIETFAAYFRGMSLESSDDDKARRASLELPTEDDVIRVGGLEIPDKFYEDHFDEERPIIVEEIKKCLLNCQDCQSFFCADEFRPSAIFLLQSWNKKVEMKLHWRNVKLLLSNVAMKQGRRWEFN